MPTSVELIRSARLSSLAEYAYAATAPVGARLIFLAGACPLDQHENTVGRISYELQASKCVENLIVVLEAAGASLTDVITTRVLVATTNQNDLIQAWDVVRSAFGSHDVPSTLMGVTVLGYTDQLVEIEAVAAVLD
ncbi:enamine deaminase RidA (YjgF/YER057c/UK114 family) [Cryobacterium sp. CAN_C3]|uniref:RidA family protein n=1 Tax=unclassified Cryobacterium TaxID=2649013 RepID=UPI0018CB4FC3|nr:Rid family hydrolase [Cryobacterium sp. CAN_C3]MEC5152766.1 enamine deaminase RidA (YjgF/YER057c/UK114 family) [Cryobacterium sp. CAN_C3]